jgi:hypothetical protein
MKEKGFIQIPLLIVIITSVVVVAGIGYRVFDYYKDVNNELLFSDIPIINITTTTVFSSDINFFSSTTMTTLGSSTALTTSSTATTTLQFFSTTTTKGETYVYHDYYPIILSLSDEEGNVIKLSAYNKYKGPYSFDNSNKSLKIGDEIYLKVETNNPQNREILYNWKSSSQHFNQLIGLEGDNLKWTKNNELRYIITPEDMKVVDGIMNIVVRIKSEKEYLRCPEGGYDDMASMNYILVSDTTENGITFIEYCLARKDEGLLEELLEREKRLDQENYERMKGHFNNPLTRQQWEEDCIKLGY